jgi:hypothetical protein
MKSFFGRLTLIAKYNFIANENVIANASDGMRNIVPSGLTT